jgi:hypothetical protein
VRRYLDALPASGDDTAALLAQMDAILREANDIPVVMKEEMLLSQEFACRNWALRARRVLASKPRLETLEVSVVAALCGCLVATHPIFAPNDVQKLAAEFKELRQRFPAAERSVTWNQQREDVELRRMMKAADKWCVPHSRCVVDSVACL